MEQRKKAIAIIGPTASGKTKLAVRLAREIDGEIISVDSRQVFRKMNIGTGKDLGEYGNIPYHLIDILDPGEEFSVSDFQEETLNSLDMITQRNRIPILCGGTGHYFKAILEDYEFSHIGTDRKLTEELELKSRNELYQVLKDLGLWETHHWEKDSKRRMCRAIEKAALSPKEKEKTRFQDQYEIQIYALWEKERNLQRERIRIRLEDRLKNGLLEEVEFLWKEEDVSEDRLNRYGLEYKWILQFLKKEISLEAMTEKLYTEICRFAKRQMTFIRYLEKQGHQIRKIEDPNSWIKDVQVWLGSLNTD